MSADKSSHDAFRDWLLARDAETASADDSDHDSRPPQADRFLKFCRLLEMDSLPGAAPAPAPPQEPVNGRYESLVPVGSGGVGMVYKAWDPVLKRHVALKFLRADVIATPEARARFEREAQIAAGLRHPHIVTVYDFGTTADGRAYLVMEWMSGSLAARWDEFVGRPKKVAKLVEQVARAIQYAHAYPRGVIHRDLKPGNILLSESGDASVADFGIAKLVQTAADPPVPPGNTRPEDVETLTDRLGTLPYMAPERFGANATAGPASDVWAIGVVLYELLTGRRPFDGRTHREWENVICTQRPVGPRQINRRIPGDLERACLKCLARRPEDRWASAGAVADAVGSRSRWRVVMTAGLAVVVVAISVALGFAWFSPEAQFNRQVTAAQAQFKEHGKLDLLTAGSGGKALAVKRWGAEATDFRQDADGFSIDTTRTVSLVEFIPVVPAERYTIRATARLRWSQNGKPVFGVVCKYAAFNTTEGSQNYVHVLYVANEVSVLLEQRWYGEGPEDGFTFGRNARSGLTPTRTADFSQKFQSPVQGAEWDLMVRVTPTGVTGTCTRSDGITVALGPITADDTAMFCSQSVASYPDVRPFERQLERGSGVGLLVGCGAWTVRRFEVVLDQTE